MPPTMIDDAPTGSAQHPQGRRGGLRRGNVILGLGVACFVAMAIFWLLILSGWFNTTSPDRLSDRAWVARADQRCKAVQAQINALPRAQTAKNPAERAASIDKGTADLQVLVDELASDRLDNTSDQGIVDQWLDDWRVYLGDRTAYAQKIQQDPATKTFFTERHGEAVPDAIGNFATVNSMPNCLTPTDL